ncbi:hypothetical protein CWB96_00375 [Pseudoalteromonas citrea]|uniref:Right handed beta helix domain-containing protein n=1 Tax=Pseudoalteromonas citrea TaxID=43655 RepID=A0A5S3XVB3_9GAMM|nr:hypothetical protein [Pseudoalteromonas citrea]TMP46322.1 hypothetical protein CWB97_02370 [Pseudoalteromonas citrea]TMP63098.1 hypothetical protein CWB96_00375 [Pseudoalteromonas citrea]
MTHPNRFLHKGQVSAGVIDNNPYPADLQPEQLQTHNSLAMLTKQVRNEHTAADSIFEETRSLRYPTFSLHGKTGSFHVDQDGTYRFYNCTINQVSFETTATLLFYNCTIKNIKGALSHEDPHRKIKILMFDCILETVEHCKHFYLSLHGKTQWYGGLYNCQFGTIRLLQSEHWVAQNNLLDCSDLVMSFSLSNHAKITPTGLFFAKNTHRCRFHWQETDLIMGHADSVMFDQCSHILSQHHAANIDTNKYIASHSEHIGLTFQSCHITTKKWYFSNILAPVFSAINCTLETKNDTESGLLKDCENAKVRITSRSECNLGGLLCGSASNLYLSDSKVSAKTTIVDATASSVTLKATELHYTGPSAAIKLSQDSEVSLSHCTLIAPNGCCELTNVIAQLDMTNLESSQVALKIHTSQTILRSCQITGSIASIDAQNGSISCFYSVLNGDLASKKCSTFQLDGSRLTGSLLLTDISSIKLNSNEISGSVIASGAHYESAANTTAQNMTIKNAVNTLSEDKVAGSLSVSGINLISNVNASSVTNTGFMLLEGGTGAEILSTNKRGWHVTGSMDWVIDENLDVNIGKNLNWKVAMNANYNIGKNINYQVGKIASLKAGSLIKLNAPLITEN